MKKKSIKNILSEIKKVPLNNCLQEAIENAIGNKIFFVEFKNNDTKTSKRFVCNEYDLVIGNDSTGFNIEISLNSGCHLVVSTDKTDKFGTFCYIYQKYAKKLLMKHAENKPFSGDCEVFVYAE